jgi:hypothetical protein
MNPETDPLYAGIAGVEIDVDHFDLGSGITVSRTYGHLMAPFLMAFAPAKAGKPHPTPWSAVQGGLGIDFHVELHVPETLDIEDSFDRLNTVWWLVALIRLRGAYLAHVPVLASKAFAEIPSNLSDA